MANQTPLATWLYSKRLELNPKFKEFSWPSRWLPGLFDFATTITWNGIEADGRGVDERREIALEKSVAEAIERLLCKSLGIDSVGFAVAGTHDPSPHAQNEALERYFINQHIQEQEPFKFLKTKPEMALLFEKLNVGSKVNFYRMATAENIFGIVCMMTKDQDLKTSLGFALSDSLENSLRRSMLEALPSYVWLLEEELTHESAVIPWHIGSDFLSQIVPLLGSDGYADESKMIEFPQVNEVEIDYSHISTLKNAPIQIARYSNFEPRALK